MTDIDFIAFSFAAILAVGIVAFYGGYYHGCRLQEEKDKVAMMTQLGDCQAANRDEIVRFKEKNK